MTPSSGSTAGRIAAEPLVSQKAPACGALQLHLLQASGRALDAPAKPFEVLKLPEEGKEEQP